MGESEGKRGGESVGGEGEKEDGGIGKEYNRRSHP